MWRRLLQKWKRFWCGHDNFEVMYVLGPTSGKRKTWVSCRCKDCGQWFVYENSIGKRYMMDGPGFGFKSIS